MPVEIVLRELLKWDFVVADYQVFMNVPSLLDMFIYVCESQRLRVRCLAFTYKGYKT